MNSGAISEWGNWEGMKGWEKTQEFCFGSAMLDMILGHLYVTVR